MMDRLSHRGPDDAGTFSSPDGSGVLGFRRLSIMDPTGGHQPIIGQDEGRAIIANGEIYNFPSIREELAARQPFETGSDSEAILRLYEEHGTAVVQHLDGMYAFAILDGNDIFLARDPIGIKPLYVGCSESTAIFASELKALAGRCQDVTEFPPGAYYHSQVGFSRFYEVPRCAPHHDSVAAWTRRIRETMEGCVAKQLMSDVPLGFFLSGGVDSSVICALARRHVDEMHTFSVGIEGSGDLEPARRVAGHLDTIHHEYVLTAEEVAQALPEVIYYLESFDQDLVRSAIPTYFTARLAAEYVDVVLTGEGADELFAGYSYHKAIADDDILNRELRRSVGALHNLNLQRVDRMTMAHALEARPPFLDEEMIALAQQVPAELKLHGSSPSEQWSKWILRKAFEEMLPAEIVWRRKAQFDEGSGLAELASAEVYERMSNEEAEAHRARHPGIRLRSAEECYYHRLLLDAFEDPEPVVANVGRWTERPPEIG
ncbi:MAG: asparagine synthase B [Actinomycetota bacterium]|nr:asparagine synthase B [Actinomycetota bacterium]